MDIPLKREFNYFLANHEQLVAQYNGKFVVIKGEEVLAAYDDQETAIAETVKTHLLGTFLVQKVEPGNRAYTQTFHSRVSFRRSA